MSGADASLWRLMLSVVGVAAGQLLTPRIAKRFGAGTARLPAVVFDIAATVVLTGGSYLLFPP